MARVEDSTVAGFMATVVTDMDDKDRRRRQSRTSLQ
jgi:hypothetical protein